MQETEETASSSAGPTPGMEADPLLRDLQEKKQTFRRNVMSLAAELKEVRGRLSSQEQSFAKETVTRQEAESRAMNMKVEIDRLQKSLEERNLQLQASNAACETHTKELGDLRLQLSETKATTDASAVIIREQKQKKCSSKQHKSREHINDLHHDLRAGEFSQMLLADEVSELESLQAIAKNGANKDCELQIDKLLSLKDDEISKLRDEIRLMSTHWNLKTAELESRLDKQIRADMDLKKKVLKLEFCLQENRAQTRKLLRMEEKRDKDLQELKDQLTATREQQEPVSNEKKNLWDTSGFKIVVSMSMFILVMFSKR